MNHLMMHIYPRVGGTWRDAVAEIRSRRSLFEGRRVAGVALGEGLESRESVRDTLGDLFDSVTFVDNDPGLREVATFPLLITSLRGVAGNVFYCHTKGSTHPAESICQEWRRLMFSVCLDYPALIDCSLRSHAIAGPCRRVGDMLSVPWHFSGAFYWLRAAAAWARNWGHIHQVWYGVESWPAVQFSIEESACLFLDHCQDLYATDYWDRVVRPAFAVWRERISKCTR